MTVEVAIEAIRAKTAKADDSKETTDVKMTEAVEIGNVQNAETQTSHSEQNATDVENHEVPAVETTVDDVTTVEVAIEAIRAKTAKADDSKETTAVVEMTVAVEIGNVQNAETQTSHSEQNATDVENHEVPAVETTEDDVMTVEVAIEAIRAKTAKADDSKETTDVKIIVAAAIGIVPNAGTQTSHSEPNATNVGFLALAALVVEMTVVDVGMTEAEEEMTVVDVEEHTTTMIGIVQSVTTQTLLSEPNATVVEHLALAVDVVDKVAMMEEDLLDVMMVEDPLGVMTVPEHLDAMMVEDLLDVMTVPEHPGATMVEDLPGVMTVKGLLDKTMGEGPLDVMEGTEDQKVAMATEAPMGKTGLLNVNQENLETLENPVVTVRVMPTTDHQNQSVDLEKTTREGEKWVPNITT